MKKLLCVAVLGLLSISCKATADVNVTAEPCTEECGDACASACEDSAQSCASEAECSSEKKVCPVTGAVQE